MADQDKLRQSQEDTLLEGFFSAAREAVEPSPEFLARVLEDGYGEQDRIAAMALTEVQAPVTTPSRRSLIAALWGAIGGAPGLAGLTAAALAGVWVGMSPPQGLSDVASTFWNSSTATSESGDALMDYDMAFADLLADG